MSTPPSTPPPSDATTPPPPAPGSERVGTRIRLVRQSVDLPQKDFARRLAISQSTLSQVENGRQYPTYQTILGIAEQWGANCQWLVVGEGEPFSTETPTGATEGIIVIHEKALAGYAENHRDELWLSSRERYTLPGFESNGDHRVFQVLGDSMDPTIHDQDFCVCAPAEPPFEQATGHVVLVVKRDELLAKRLLGYEEARGTLVLGSDNPAFETVEVALSDTLELWHVHARLTRDLSPSFATQDLRLRQLEQAYDKLAAQVDEIRRPGLADG